MTLGRARSEAQPYPDDPRAPALQALAEAHTLAEQHDERSWKANSSSVM